MKISMRTSRTTEECFEDFILAKKAQGLADKTITSYQQQFRSLSRHLNVSIPIEDLSKSDLDNMVASIQLFQISNNQTDVCHVATINQHCLFIAQYKSRICLSYINVMHSKGLVLWQGDCCWHSCFQCGRLNIWYRWFHIFGCGAAGDKDHNQR